MRVLLIRPDPGNERFGLGPFFRVEPLGLEYVAAALRARGDEPAILDARFDGAIAARIRDSGARMIGIACAHALEFERVIDMARLVRRAAPGAFVVAGGHAAAAYPAPLEIPEIDAICTDDGERVIPELAQALERGARIAEVPGLRLRSPEGFVATLEAGARVGLDIVDRAARDLVERHRKQFHCLLFRPVWLVETARGCPFRCTFCSVWQHYDRSFRERGIGAVADDFAAVGEHVFVVDDLFWHGAERSAALAHELRRRGIRKRWMLVQTRTDLVCRHPELLEAWRPIAQDFDIFFGLEASTDRGLAHLSKDALASDTVRAAEIARSLRYGVTGNFVVDPDWEEEDFRSLWDFVAAHRLERAGYTILTPLPGTDLHERMADKLAGQPWHKYDMHHALWEPRLGAARFFELYAETWRRSILNLKGKKRLGDWAAQVRVREIPYLTRVLLRTQRMMKPAAYLSEH